MTYSFTLVAMKRMKKLPKRVQRRILDKLDYFMQTPDPLVFADRLINHDIGQYRYRIGDYRVVFDLDDDEVVVLDVGHRRDIYR